MPVNTPSAYYISMIDKWSRCRAAYQGADEVKAEGTRFLPALDSHEDSWRDYADYKSRAMYYNATGRTVDGLVGAIFTRPPEFHAPSIEGHLDDITLTSESAEAFAARTTREVFITGRYGVLVELSGAIEGPPRPYWVGYRTEDIISTRTMRISGDEVLCRVVLREVVEVPQDDDLFVSKQVEQYRVLYLCADEGEEEVGEMFYRQDVYRKSPSGHFVRDGETITPQRRGERMTYIPMAIIGPNGMDDTPTRPPLQDLVDVNLSHYRTMADLEHGRHYVALPTPVVSGITGGGDSSPLRIGSSEAWVLEQGGDAKMLEFTGQGLGALQTADTEKRHMMATLGARLLESQGGAAETATAVTMRHSGDHATLRSVATSIEQSITAALRWHAWWVGTEKTPGEVDASAELNKEFYAAKLTPEELKAWVFAWQSGAASFETMFRALQRGAAYPPGFEVEDEVQLISASGMGEPSDG